MGLDERLSTGARRAVSPAAYIITLLALGNVLSFYDRQLPAALLGQIQATFGINDATAATLVSAFVVATAAAAIPLGALADRWPRHIVAGVVLIVWSAFTALGGLIGGLVPLAAAGPAAAFAILLISRIGVGIGEAGFLPSAGSLLSDLYPSSRRSRANAFLMLGLPIGVLLAFLLAGVLAQTLGSWQAVFLIAAPPGLIVGVLLLLVREPPRGSSETASPRGRSTTARGGVRASLRVVSFRGLIVTYAAYTLGTYALATFTTVTLQRSFDLADIPAGALSAVILGAAGLVGLLLGGFLLDRAASRSEVRRVQLTAAFLIVGAALCFVGLASSDLVVFVTFASMGYLLGSAFVAASVPMIADVIPPSHRSTAIGAMFAFGLLLGGAIGPLAAGFVSDAVASPKIALQIVVPAAFAVAGLALLRTARFFPTDLVRASTRGMANSGAAAKLNNFS